MVLSMRGLGRPVGVGLGVLVGVGSGVAEVLAGVLGGGEEGGELEVGAVGAGSPPQAVNPPKAAPAAVSRTVRRVSTPRFSCQSGNPEVQTSKAVQTFLKGKAVQPKPEDVMSA
jgi:hypothetical protein